MTSIASLLFRQKAGASGAAPSTRGEIAGLLVVLAAVILLFSLTTDRFLSAETFTSIAFQLPELGLLTLAMLMPLISGGFNLAITFTANISGLAFAWVLQAYGGADAGVAVFALGVAAALLSGAIIGGAMGVVIAYTGAHPILVSLSMMIFLRGLGEFLTRGGDISGFPTFVVHMGQGTIFGIPIPLLIFMACVALWTILLKRTRLGFRNPHDRLELRGHPLFGRRHAQGHHAGLYALRRHVRDRRHRHADPVQFGSCWTRRVLSPDHRACEFPRPSGSLRRLRPGDPRGDRPRRPSGDRLRPQPARHEPASGNGTLGRNPDCRDDRPICLGKAASWSVHPIRE